MNMISRPQILLVDDEERFVISLQEILGHYHYQCTVSTTGKEALRLLREGNFDLALLDVNLPDISGCEILRILNSEKIGTTFIMLTGISTVEVAVQAMKQGAYDFLSKPINHEHLIRTIDKAYEHSRLTRELAASERRFRILVEASFEGIVIHENGMLIEANNQFFSMFGFSYTELSSINFLDKILTPQSSQKLAQYIEYEVFGCFELTGIRKDGKEFPLEAYSRKINCSDKPAFVCTLRDVSERVKVEEEKIFLQRKLAKANKLKALGLMAGSVAHDLNNILSGIVSYPELLLSQMKKSDRFYSEIARIQEAGKRAAAVVADLVLLARGGATSFKVESINEIILSHLSSIEHRERLAKYPNVLIQTNLQQDLWNTPCSHLHIHKILLNLIGNALEAVKGSGLIRISTGNCQYSHPERLERNAGNRNYVKITICDNGPGIPPHDVDHIFDPFYSTKKKGKSGTGLGLSIVWNTVQQHNGWVEVKDNNPGAIFEVYLPATTESINLRQSSLVAHPPRGNGEKILLIDDLDEQNETISELLTNLGYSTCTVTSGEEGVSFLKVQAVDLVLLDMLMEPGMNGRQTYEKILQIRPGQKAIIISGYSETDEISKVRELGVSRFLEKPVTLPVLALAIRQELHGS
jgi:PAS domain S-box-containing protein